MQLAHVPQVDGREASRAREGSLQVTGQLLDDTLAAALHGLLLANGRANVQYKPTSSELTARAAVSRADAMGDLRSATKAL